MNKKSSNKYKNDSAAVQFMTLDILENIMRYSDNPGNLGKFLTQHVREIIGGRIVILLQCVHGLETAEHRMISVHPRRYKNLATSKEVEELALYSHDIDQPELWKSGNSPPVVNKLLSEMGCHSSIAIPLNVGKTRVGVLLIFDLLDMFAIDKVFHILEILSGFTALVLRNSLLYEFQEKTIEERTRELATSEANFRAIFEKNMDAIGVTKSDKHIVTNASYLKMFGYSRPEELADKSILDLIALREHGRIMDYFSNSTKEEKVPSVFETFGVKQDGSEFNVSVQRSTYELNQETYSVSILRNITEKKLAEEEVIQKTIDLTLVNTLNDAINRGTGLHGLIDILVRKTKEVFSSYGATILLLNDKKTHLEMKNITLSPKLQTIIEKLIGYKISRLAIPLEDESFYEKLLKEGIPKLTKDPAGIKQLIFDYVNVLPDNIALKIEKLYPKIIKILKIKSMISAPLISEGEVIGVFEVSSLKIMTDQDMRRIEIIAGQVTALIKRLHAEGDLLKNQFLLSKAQELGEIGTWGLDIQENFLTWTDEIYRIFGVPLGTEINFEKFLSYIHPDDKAYVDEKWGAALNHEPYDVEHRVIIGDAIKWVREKADIEFDNQSKPISAIGFTQDITYRKQAEEELRRYENIVSSSSDMLALLNTKFVYLAANSRYMNAFNITHEELVGKTVTDVFGEEFFEKMIKSNALQCLSGEQISYQSWFEFPSYGSRFMEINYYPYLDNYNEVKGFVVNGRDITKRKKAEEMVKRQLQFTSALHDIDLAITSSLDLNLTLKIVLEHTLSQLEADAAVVFLLDKILNLLSCKTAIGFTKSTEVQNASIKLGESFAGQIALNNEILISNFENVDIASDFLKLIREEKFVSYAGAPLVAKGQVLGVLEVYKRTHINPDSEWIRFFGTLAGQAAIAIDNISLFNNLQQSNLELGLGYEQTIEGWAKTLEMRDAETEGHSQRVTDMTVILARRMGIKAEELVHVRRGALLHDIGKMNIPDSIMQKESGLDDAEWEIMKKHTEYAFEFLSPIKFLEPALDIPQFHHEKWDGTGYPHELKGEQIPLSARIFAVVDVYDALLSDRPYRKAWPMKKVIKHIKEQSGKHFDPAVVEVFLQIQK